MVALFVSRVLNPIDRMSTSTRPLMSNMLPAYDSAPPGNATSSRFRVAKEEIECAFGADFGQCPVIIDHHHVATQHQIGFTGGDAQLEVGAGVGCLLLEVEGCLVVEGGGVFVQVEFVVVVEELVADGAWLLLDG